MYTINAALIRFHENLYYVLCNSMNYVLLSELFYLDLEVPNGTDCFTLELHAYEIHNTTNNYSENMLFNLRENYSIFEAHVPYDHNKLVIVPKKNIIFKWSVRVYYRFSLL